MSMHKQGRGGGRTGGRVSASGARDGTRLHCLTHTHELGRRGADAGRACEGESGGVGECVRGRVCARVGEKM